MDPISQAIGTRLWFAGDENQYENLITKKNIALFTHSTKSVQTPGYDGCENKWIATSLLGMIGTPNCDDAFEFVTV